MNDLTINEAHIYLTTGELPANFRGRCELMLQGAREHWYACKNCGGQRCMHLVMRDWHEGSGIDECDGMCCPYCGDFWRAQGRVRPDTETERPMNTDTSIRCLNQQTGDTK